MSLVRKAKSTDTLRAGRHVVSNGEGFQFFCERGQKNTHGRGFFLSTVWVSGIKLRLIDFAAGPLPTKPSRGPLRKLSSDRILMDPCGRISHCGQQLLTGQWVFISAAYILGPWEAGRGRQDILLRV